MFTVVSAGYGNASKEQHSRKTGVFDLRERYGHLLRVQQECFCLVTSRHTKQRTRSATAAHTNAEQRMLCSF